LTPSTVTRPDKPPFIGDQLRAVERGWERELGTRALMELRSLLARLGELQ